MVGSEQPNQLGEREEAVGIGEALLVLAVASFDFAVVTRRVRSNELMANAKRGRGRFKQRLDIALAVGETVGELKAIVRLHSFNLDAMARVPANGTLEEIGGGISTVFVISGEKTNARELVDGGILEQLQVWIGDAASGNDLDVNLDAFARMGHLLIRFGNVLLLFLPGRAHAESAQYSIETFRTTGIAVFTQTIPQFDQTDSRISAAIP